MLDQVLSIVTNTPLLRDPVFLVSFLLLARHHLNGTTPATLASVLLVVLMSAAASQLAPFARDSVRGALSNASSDDGPLAWLAAELQRVAARAEDPPVSPDD